MTIEAETFFLGRSIRKRRLPPGTEFTSKEKERWIPQDPTWRVVILYLTCRVVNPNTIEVRSSQSRKRRPDDPLEMMLVGTQIEGKEINGRITTTRLSWKP